MSDSHPTGFTCKCGKTNNYPDYVFAHSSEILVFTCECKRKYELFRGHEKEIK